ncbi:MAG: glycosyltransferase [Gammaproteobacteria bacterium]
MNKKKLLFYRDFRRFTGGHLKHWNYFCHTRKSQHYTPVIYFSPLSNWSEENPWYGLRQEVLANWAIESADALFLAGEDWQMYPPEAESRYALPVINLIQGLRHANPEHELYQCLSRPAIRICVSRQVADAISATGRVNGPIYTIPNGLVADGMPQPASSKHAGLLIVAAKNPHLGRMIQQQLSAAGHAVALLDGHVPRAEFLASLNAYRNVLLLPQRLEGFFLPALEAMALKTLVICPDCIGNRDFCLDGINCLRPNYDSAAVAASCLTALGLSNDAHKRIVDRAHQIAGEYRLDTERQRYLDILDRMC